MQRFKYYWPHQRPFERTTLAELHCNGQEGYVVEIYINGKKKFIYIPLREVIDDLLRT